MEIRRYAIFTCPPEGAFASAAASWLGWDSGHGKELASPVGKLSKRPRKYGFHGTLKAPFRLAEGYTEQGLIAAVDTLAAGLNPPAPFNLSLAQIGGFLALVPEGDSPDLTALAAKIVRGLDSLRAPMNEAERQRRRNLSLAEEANLEAWGYPYVMEQFRFHMTLTGHLGREDSEDSEDVRQTANAHFAEHIQVPYQIRDICVMGEAAESGRFHVIKRIALKEG